MRQVVPQSLSAIVALALVSCRAPGGGSSGRESATTDYMTEDEALRLVFPGSRRLVSERLVLRGEERERAESRLEARILEPSFTVHAGVKADGSLDGFAVIHEEIGKFKPFKFIVGLEPNGAVRRVAILSYRESRGGEIARRRFLSQYPGKRASDPIRLNRDILGISGATMSVNSLNAGVKKVLAVVSSAYLGQPMRIEQLLKSPGAALEPMPDHPEPASGDVLVSETRLVMGALCEIRAFGPDRAWLRGVVARAFSRIEAADHALSNYRPTSELSELSRKAGEELIQVSRLTGEFLELSARIAEESQGAFDMTVGPLVRAWGVQGPVASEPTAEDLAQLRPLVGPQGVVLERDASGAFRARLKRHGMALDPGALGKGFAVDLAARSLREDGVQSALIDFSGNMYAVGSPPGLEAWPIAVRDPVEPTRILGILRLRDAAISSSGNYERHAEVGGRPRSHIVSPLTLQPVDGVHGTSVTAPTAGLADGYSTAAFVLGREGTAFLEGRPGVEGLVAIEETDGSRFFSTKGWRLE